MERRVLWNGSALDLAVEQPITLDGVLRALGERLTQRGHVVTGVRLDGVDEPAFGADFVSGRALPPSTVVEIESDLPGVLLERSLGEALQALPAVRAGVLAVSDAYRESNRSAGDRMLVEVAESLGNLVALAATVGSALGTPLDRVAIAGTSGAEIVNQLHSLTDRLFDAHRSEHWTLVADTLEGELAPLLAVVGQLLGQLAADADATGERAAQSA